MADALTLLFWNLNRQLLTDRVVELAHEREVDILVLAECTITIGLLLSALNTGQVRKYALPFAPPGKLQVLARLPRAAVRPVRDSLSATFRRIQAPFLPEFLLVGAHLPSKLRMSDDDQMHACVQVARDIEEAEHRLGHRRTLVIGDLNMNPFESAVVGSSGLHAVMSRAIAQRGSRTVQGVERPLFYNPMWSHFGDRLPSPPGTYYYSSAAPVAYFWHMFDQVLIRPELLSNVADQDVTVITAVNGRSLLNSAGVPDQVHASDHLPLSVRLTF